MDSNFSHIKKKKKKKKEKNGNNSETAQWHRFIDDWWMKSSWQTTGRHAPSINQPRAVEERPLTAMATSATGNETTRAKTQVKNKRNAITPRCEDKRGGRQGGRIT